MCGSKKVILNSVFFFEVNQIIGAKFNSLVSRTCKYSLKLGKRVYITQIRIELPYIKHLNGRGDSFVKGDRVNVALRLGD